MSATVRVTPQTHAKLKALSEQAGESMPVVLEKAVEEYRRKQLLDQANRDYAALRADADAWQAEVEERELWEGTLLDGLETEPHQDSGAT